MAGFQRTHYRIVPEGINAFFSGLIGVWLTFVLQPLQARLGPLLFATSLATIAMVFGSIAMDQRRGFVFRGLFFFVCISFASFLVPAVSYVRNVNLTQGAWLFPFLVVFWVSSLEFGSVDWHLYLQREEREFRRI